jgi:ATP-dependent Lon protease
MPKKSHYRPLRARAAPETDSSTDSDYIPSSSDESDTEFKYVLCKTRSATAAAAAAASKKHKSNLPKKVMSDKESAPPRKKSRRSSADSSTEEECCARRAAGGSKKRGRERSSPTPAKKRISSDESDSDENESETEYSTVYETESTEEDEETDETDDTDETDETEESEETEYSPRRQHAPPIFITLAPLPNKDYFGEAGEESGEDLEGNKEDYTSEDERTFMKETYHKFQSAATMADENAASTSAPPPPPPEPAELQISAAKKAQNEYTELIELKKQLLEKLEEGKQNRILKKAIKDCNNSIKKLVKSTRVDNTKQYINLLQNGGKSKKTSEVDFFKKKMSNREQLKIMEELTQINNYIYIEKPHRIALLETQMPPRFKAIALEKLNILKRMEPGDNEYYKIKNWVDNFMRIPFGIYKSLNVSIADGKEVCHNFICAAKKTLDECVFGLDDAKMQILQMVGQWIANPNSMGTAIAIKGPPGTGKTSLIRDGVSKIFGREFAFLALGGATDSSFLEGHSYTYEGSQWGRIVQILINGRTMNPVIFFDELDKVSDTPRGEEIIGVLTHLTDTTQNSQFHDKYFSEIDFDMSKCLFVFSYNDESKVNHILRDRMYVIQTKGYDVKEKLVIARKYLLPKIREQVSFGEEDIIVPDDVITYIASNREMTKDEQGVRNLKRCLEIIHTKLNLFRLVNPGTDIFKNDLDLDVEFPVTVTRKMVDQLIKMPDKTQNQSLLAMYV